jgi:hypothetical protein
LAIASPIATIDAAARFPYRGGSATEPKSAEIGQKLPASGVRDLRFSQSILIAPLANHLGLSPARPHVGIRVLVNGFSPTESHWHGHWARRFDGASWEVNHTVCRELARVRQPRRILPSNAGRRLDGTIHCSRAGAPDAPLITQHDLSQRRLQILDDGLHHLYMMSRQNV